jgi:hypothetical protein
MRVFWLAAFGAGALVACGGGASPSAPPPVVTTPAALNPDGFTYPSGPYGRAARSGITPGSIIQNFAFLGYLNGNKANGLTRISLADYYDPCGKRYSLLRLSAAAVWCVPCNNETDAIVLDKPTLDTERVVVIQALSDGPTMGVGATQADLDYWVNKHSSNFTEMLDPDLTNLGGFFKASEIPWNCDIDPRTMEILQSATGFGGDVNGDLMVPLSDLGVAPGTGVAMAKPAYPIPVTCN